MLSSVQPFLLRSSGIAVGAAVTVERTAVRANAARERVDRTMVGTT